MKNYRFYGQEMELLGCRLGAARRALANSKNSWSRTYWQSCVDRLTYQWTLLPILHDGEAQVSLIPRWTVTYDHFEASEEIGRYGIMDRAYDMMFRHSTNLDDSWHRNREARLARAQF
jgi:hypothetical protein